MTAQTPRNLRECTELLETAVHCYLSTILSAADCIAQICPEVGVPYQHRWRRLPQRLGFDISAKTLEASGQMFESDMENFSRLAGRYFTRGLPLIKGISGEGAPAIRAVVEAASSHSAVLETMAESLETAADLDAPPELREMLEMQAEGLRRYAQQVRSRLLPPVQQLAKLVTQCADLQHQTEDDAILDPETGFVNPGGFRYEVDNYFRNRKHCCVVTINCTALLLNGQPCSDADFSTILVELASRVGEQFRPADALGRIAPRRFAVIFNGEPEFARARIDQISRSISGRYISSSGPITLTAEIRVIEADDPDSLSNALFDSGGHAPAGTAAAD